MVFGSGETASEVLVALRWDSQTRKYARQVPGQDEGLDIMGKAMELGPPQTVMQTAGGGQLRGPHLVLSKIFELDASTLVICLLPGLGRTFLCGHGPSSSCEGGRSSAGRSQGSKLFFIFNRICCMYLDRTGQTSMCLMSSSRHVKGGYELLNPLT